MEELLNGAKGIDLQFRDVGAGGAEGLQLHQYFSITVVKGVCTPTDKQEML